MSSIPRLITKDRVLAMIKDFGPIEMREVSRRCRRKSGPSKGGKDTVSRQVSACIFDLHQEGKIIPTKINEKLTTWNSI